MRRAQVVMAPSLSPRPPTLSPLCTPPIRLDIPLTPHRHGNRPTTTSLPLPPCPSPLPQVEQHLVRPLPKRATPPPPMSRQPRPLATGAQRAKRHRHYHQLMAKWRRKMAWPITCTWGRVAWWQKVARSRALAQTILDYLPCWQGGRALRRARDRQKGLHPQHLPRLSPSRKLTTSTRPSCPPPPTRRAARLPHRPSLPYPPPHPRPNPQNTPKQAPTVLPPPHLLHLP